MNIQRLKLDEATAALLEAQAAGHNRLRARMRPDDIGAVVFLQLPPDGNNLSVWDEAIGHFTQRVEEGQFYLNVLNRAAEALRGMRISGGAAHRGELEVGFRVVLMACDDEVSMSAMIDKAQADAAAAASQQTDVA